MPRTAAAAPPASSSEDRLRRGAKGKDAGGVGPHAEERRMPERDEPAITDEQVQRHRV